MSLLLYFNLYAQSEDGLGLTPLQSGAALLPLSAALLALALSVSMVTARVGLRRAMMGCMGLIVIASAIIGVAASGAGILLMEIGFVAMGAGLALPYAAAPRLALSALSQEQAGQGSGIINACSFLAGSVGVAGGAHRLALRRLPWCARDDRVGGRMRRCTWPRCRGRVRCSVPGRSSTNSLRCCRHERRPCGDAVEPVGEFRMSRPPM